MRAFDIENFIKIVKNSHLTNLMKLQTPEERIGYMEEHTLTISEIPLNILDARYCSHMLQTKHGVDMGVCKEYSIEKRKDARLPEHNDYDEYCSFGGQKIETTCNGHDQERCVFLNRGK